MKNFPTANQLSGRAIGSMFFSIFGTIWILLALYARQELRPATVSVTLLATFVLLSLALYLARQSARWPRVPDTPTVGRAFAWINAIQWIAISGVAFSFAKLHIDAYVMNAIAAVVGLHMFPLARLFRHPLHYATGALLIAWAAASAVLAPVDRLQGIAALGTGLILWLSAAVTLSIALQAARQPAEPLPC